MDPLEIDTSHAGRSRFLRSRRIVAVLGAAALVVATIGASAALAASPSTGTTPPATPAAPDPATVEAAFKDYAACMRDHGIDMPDPVTMSASAVSPDGAAVTLTPGGSAGSTMTSVVVAAGRAGTAATAGAQASSDEFADADKACSPILAAAGIETSTTGAASVSGASGLTSGGLTITGSGTIASGAGVAGAVVAGGDTTAIAADMKAYAACMRTHGVDLPDPVVDAKTGSVSMQLDSDPTSAAFRTADAACSANGFGFAVRLAPTATAAP